MKRNSAYHPQASTNESVFLASGRNEHDVDGQLEIRFPVRSTTISVVELQGNSDSGRERLRLPTASLTIVFSSGLRLSCYHYSNLAIRNKELKYKMFYWITVSGDRD